MDRLAREQDAGDVIVSLSGGEPLLVTNRQPVTKILDMAAQRKWCVSFLTNGTQVHHFFDVLQQFQESVHHLQVTVDGPAEIHNQWRVQANGDGTFDVIAGNISSMLALGLRVGVRVNVGPANVRGLPDLFRVFDERGWVVYPSFVCQVSPVSDHQNTGSVSNYQAEFKLLEQLYAIFPDWEKRRDRYHVVLGREMERRINLFRRVLYKGEVRPHPFTPGMTSCGSGSGRCVALGADGMIYPCPETVGQPQYAIGRFDPEFTLDRPAWSRWLVDIASAPKCTKCNLAPICGTGCTFQGICTGSLDSFEPCCNYAQETVRTFLELNRDRLIRLAEA